MEPDSHDGSCMNHLMRNETYMNAIQKASVSVFDLGFKPLDRRLKGSQTMRTPVIPIENQDEFLERVNAAVQDYVHHNRMKSRKSKMRYSMGNNNNSPIIKELLKIQTTMASDDEQEDSQEEDNHHHHNNRPKSAHNNNNNNNKKKKINLTRLTRSTNRMKEYEEKIKQEIMEKEKEQKHFQRISSSIAPFLEHGKLYIYNEKGRKISLEYYENLKLQQQKEKERILQVEEEIAKQEEIKQQQQLFKKNKPQQELLLLQKTCKHVERIRLLTNSQRKEYPLWKPHLLPCSTFPLSDEHHTLPLHCVFRRWPEHDYDKLEIGDCLLTIEHCAHCEYHQETTHHHSATYAQQAKDILTALKDSCSR
jgi:hypothetical protein